MVDGGPRHDPRGCDRHRCLHALSGHHGEAPPRLRLLGAGLLLLLAAGGAAPEALAPPPCATAPLRTTGTVYYYCDCQAGAAAGCLAGDDANAGTSPESPRRTFAGAASRFEAMNAGDTIAFCRGGAWSTPGARWANPRCTKASPCEVRDYAPASAIADAARPRIQVTAGNAFDLNRGGHEEGYRFWNLDVRGGQWGFFLYSDVAEVDICNVNVAGAQIAVHQGSGAVGQARNGKLTVRDSTISNSVKQGILAAADGLTIAGNLFVDNGVSTKFDHALYLQGETIPGANPQDAYETRGVLVANNRFLQSSACKGAIIVVHGRYRGLTIENNLLEAPAGAPECYGIGVGHGGYPYGCWFRDTSVVRNRVLLGGGRVGIALNASTGSIISDNLVTLNAKYADGIVVPDDPGNGGVVNTGTVIQNNTIRSTHANVDYGIWVRSYEGTGYVVVNNAVFFDASRNPCISIERPTLLESNNYCRSAGGAPLERVFVDAPNGNYRPVAPGPLIGAGHPSRFSSAALGTTGWSAEDAGAPRRGAIDVGAHVR